MIIGLKNLRSHIVVSTIFLVVLSLFTPVVGFSQDAVSMPGGVGRDLVSNKCVSCHALSTALVKRASEDEWEETVTRMVSTYMAPINDSDKSVILDYLSANFGEDSTYNPGQQMLAEQCFRCHGNGMWIDLKTDRTGWLSVLYRMVGRGGKWTPDQINAMADYLAEMYPAGARE